MNLEQNIIEVPISDIIPNRFQPRVVFDDAGLEELANSIKTHGIIQPLVLRRFGDKYEIIAGERRFKASTLAGLAKVPAVISNIDDNKSAEVAIVENIQRRDLTPIEEARSYKLLLDKGYLTQSELAKKMGLSQSAIANKLRLLNLDESVQQALLNNEISERHARSLLVLNNPDDQKAWLEKIKKERLTVRDLDEALKNVGNELDVPFVKNVDIEVIQNEAKELPKIDENSDIRQKIKEIENEEKYNPDLIPIEQTTNDSKNNFFNFLENEKVNMNMEENKIVNPEVNTTIIEDLPKDNIKHNNNFGNLNFNDEQIEVFDPVDLIETLDPNYNNKIEEELGLDLKTAINTIREIKDNLANKGFNIAIEETDLMDSYQFIIKIGKK